MRRMIMSMIRIFLDTAGGHEKIKKKHLWRPDNSIVNR